MNNADTTRPTNAPAPVIELGADLSPAVAALEKAYRQIQRRHHDVPNATIVVKRDARAWGHTTVHHTWAPAGSAQPDRLEIMVSGENLARGAEAVATTLLHEAAHARNLAAGVRDCDTNGRHNRRFADSAELLGLTVAPMGWHGLAATTLSPEAAASWKGMIATIARGLDKSAAAPRQAPKVTTGTGAGAAGGVVAPPKRGDRNLLKATCACGYNIRVSRGVLDKAQPTCSECDSPFTV